MANFNVVIPWPLLEKWLKVWREEAWREMARAKGDERDVAAGAAQTFDELLNLPERLEALEGKDTNDAVSR